MALPPLLPATRSEIKDTRSWKIKWRLSLFGILAVVAISNASFRSISMIFTTEPKAVSAFNLVRTSFSEKSETFGKGLTQFGSCMPYCDKQKLKSLLSEFVEVYEQRPWKDNMCGCLINHCASNFMVARLSGAQTIVENGVNAGMSGFIFRQAQPDAEIWHIDPLSKPICDPDKRKRWRDTGKSHYFVGPSDSVYYSQMASSFAKTDGADALEVAKEYGSKGFQDFFEIDWSKTNFDRENGLVFFDTHQRDFDNVLKARAIGFKLFLLDDNYHTNVGDMNGHSVKQVFYRGGGQAENLASVLDFYYEMPPIINPFLMDDELKAKYPAILDEVKKMTGSSKPGKPVGVVFDSNAQDMGLYQEALLDLGLPDDRKLFEDLAAVVDPKEFAWYNHMSVLGVYTE